MSYPFSYLTILLIVMLVAWAFGRFTNVFR